MAEAVTEPFNITRPTERALVLGPNFVLEFGQLALPRIRSL